MPRLRFTDRGVKALKPPAVGRVDYFDLTLPAFGLRLSATGVASWFVYYRIDQRQVRDIIGRYPAKALAEARQAAKERLELVDRGKDPRLEAARQRAQESRRRAETFSSVADAYHAGHLAKLKSGEELWLRIKDDLLPEWGTLPIRDLTRGAVMEVMDGIEKDKGIYARNRRLALLRHLLNFALDRELVDSNVSARIRLLDEPARQRILTDVEIVEIWRASAKLDTAFRQYTRMLLLLGQRRSEVSDMAFSELNEAEKVWTVPAGRMKAGIAHLIPMPDAAIALFDELPQGDARGTYCFSTGRKGDAPISGFNKLKLQLDKHILEARQKHDPEAKSMPAWRLHDFRRTFRTGLSRLRIPPHIAERCLAHLPGGIEGVYDIFAYVDEKRHAFAVWASHIERLIDPKPNVTNLDEARSKGAPI